jgi:hypothetical protein
MKFVLLIYQGTTPLPGWCEPGAVWAVAGRVRSAFIFTIDRADRRDRSSHGPGAAARLRHQDPVSTG